MNFDLYNFFFKNGVSLLFRNLKQSNQINSISQIDPIFGLALKPLINVHMCSITEKKKYCHINQ